MRKSFHIDRAYGHDGQPHMFEAFKTTTGAPYLILLDGAFLATAESGEQIGEEIEDTIRWFGWTRTNPNYA